MSTYAVGNERREDAEAKKQGSWDYGIGFGRQNYGFFALSDAEYEMVKTKNPHIHQVHM